MVDVNVAIEKRIEQANKDAQEAFWAVICKNFPEAKYGDMAPDIQISFEEMCEKAIKHWICANTSLLDNNQL